MRALAATLCTAAVLAAAPAIAAGALSFSPKDYTPDAGTLAGVAIGDLDNQHGPDLLLARRDAAKTWLLLNNGDGTFAAPAERAGCAADFDRPLIARFTPDANADALLTCGSGTFGLFAGDGTGALGSEDDHAFGTQYHAALGALDGRPGIVFPGGALPGTWVPCFIAIADLASGTPTCDDSQVISHFPFKLGNLFAPGANPPNDRDQLFGLADNHDLYVVGYASGGWSYSTRAIGGTANAQDLAVGDVNGDGLQDVVVVNEGSLSVFLSKPPTGGIDPGAQATPAGSSLEVPDHEVAELADFDGDGHPDVLVGGTNSQGEPQFAVMLGHGDGTFEPPARFSTQFSKDDTAWWLAVGDLNGDHEPDVVVANGDARVVRVFLNTTPPPPGSTAPPPGGTTPPPGPGGTTPPAFTHVTQSAARWRAGNKLARIARRIPIGTTFRFTLNEPAKVRFTFTRKGRTKGVLRFTGHAGVNSVRFQGRISRRKRLTPGRYRLVITAADAAGRAAQSRTLTFTIVR